jgi:hypothetical protein
MTSVSYAGLALSFSLKAETLSENLETQFQSVNNAAVIEMQA